MQMFVSVTFVENAESTFKTTMKINKVRRYPIVALPDT